MSRCNNLVGFARGLARAYRQLRHLQPRGVGLRFVAPLLVGFIIDHSGHLPAYAALAFIAVLPGAALAGPTRFIPARTQSDHERPTGGVRDLIANPALRRTFITGGLIITAIDLFSFYCDLRAFHRLVGVGDRRHSRDAGRGGLRGAPCGCRA